MASRLALPPGVYLALVVATIAAYGAVAIGVGPRTIAMADGQPIFDLRVFGYGPQDAAALLTALGPEGRAFYADVMLPVDLVFAALFTLAMPATLARFAPPARWVGPAQVLAALPGLLDIAENLTLRVMLRLPPEDLSEGLVRLASTLTVLKFAMLLPAASLVLWVLATARRRA